MSECVCVSSQVTFIYIAPLTIQIVTKQLHNIKIGKLSIMKNDKIKYSIFSLRHLIIEFSDVIVQLSSV